jgi:two-component system chemotaxis sensor kinase CheA
VNGFEQFRQTFFEECEELLQQLEQAAVTITSGANDPEALDSMFRAVHSIKAGAAAFELHRLVRFSHEYESVMERLRSGQAAMGEEDPAVLVKASDVLQDLVQAARAGEEPVEGLEDASLAQLTGLLDAVTGSSALSGGAMGADAAGANAEGYCIHFTPHLSMYQSANEPQLLFLALEGLGELSVEIDLDRVPALALMDPGESYLSWVIHLRGGSESEIREVFEFVEDDCDLSIEPLKSEEGLAQKETAIEAELSQPLVSGGSQLAPQSRSIRVDLDRIDSLVDMVGELVIAQTMALGGLSGVVDRRHVNELRALEDLATRTRQVQEGVMAIRMQPLKALFSRFPRIVRDLSDKLDKSVRLEIEGEATEVDKTIIEELADPLTHMIRNCLDHGLETAADRDAAGKSEVGVVRISAEHRNGRILIRVGDDGRGLDPDRLMARGIENGLLKAGAEPSRAELEDLIFHPGFSTANTVSDLSGRGVGMDVVRRNIIKLGGQVTVDSVPGEGTTFTLALPLTLAVLDGMLVSIADERFVVPLSTIIETVEPDPADLRQMPDGSVVMKIRGNAIRLIDVADAMGVSRLGKPEPLRKLAVIVETELGQHVGLVVDELLGQQQVVIKSLKANYKHVAGVAGTAILGDGRVRLILDIDGLDALNAEPKPELHPESIDTARGNTA